MDPESPVDLTRAPAPSRTALLGEASRLAWPAIVQGLLHTVVFLADRLMLGRYSDGALASMQVSGPLMWSVFSVFGAFAAGTIAVVGRAVGAGDAARARRAVAGAMTLAVVVGAAVGIAGFVLRMDLARLLAGDAPGTAGVRALAGTYLSILFPASVLYFAGFIATTSLQASGDTRTPMWVGVLAEAVNVFGNWVLIYGNLGAPELGIAGAALSSAGAFAVNGLVLSAVLFRRRHMARLVLERPDRGHRAALGSILKVSRAAFGEKVVFHTGFLVFAALVGRLGDVAMAANQALIAIESVGFIAADGFGVAAGALVAQKLGARRPEDAAAAGRASILLGTASLLTVSVLFVLFPRPLVGLFTDDPDILALGARCLLIAAAAQPLMAITDTTAAALRGAGDTRNPMWAALVGPVVVRVAGTWLFAFHLGWGLVGVWVGSTLDWAVRTVWLTLVFRAGRWKHLEV